MAAKRGHVESMYDLGFMFYAGEIDGNPNIEKAVEWLDEAADFLKSLKEKHD